MKSQHEGAPWIAQLGIRVDTAIALEHGLSREAVGAERRARKIPPTTYVATTQEGVPTRSQYEAMYDAYLHENNIPHIYSPWLPELRLFPDFVLDGCVVEINGISGFRDYDDRQKEKRQRYDDASIKSVWLTSHDVMRLYEKCRTRVLFRDRKCQECGIRQIRAGGLCRPCFMKEYHERHAKIKVCAFCGDTYQSDGPDSKFCSIEHYWRSLEAVRWPKYSTLLKMLNKHNTPSARASVTGYSQNAIRAVALELGVREGTLYVHLRRAKSRLEQS